MNKVILIGNLARDPESSTTSSGITMCRFSVAVSRGYENQNGERETDFLNVIAWRALGENCYKYLKKGSKVCVEGSIQTRSYDDKEGVKRYATDIVASNVEFLSPKGATVDFSDDNSSSNKGKKLSSKDLEPLEESSQLPF